MSTAPSDNRANLKGANNLFRSVPRSVLDCGDGPCGLRLELMALRSLFYDPPLVNLMPHDRLSCDIVQQFAPLVANPHGFGTSSRLWQNRLVPRMSNSKQLRSDETAAPA